MRFVDYQGRVVIPPSNEIARVDLSKSTERSVKAWIYLSGIGFPGLVVKDSFGLYIWVGREDCYWANVKAI